MRKNCEDALTRWADGRESAPAQQGKPIWTNGATIFSYSTALVMRVHGRFVLNITSYSKTTTVHQNALRARLPNAIEVTGVPRGWGSAEAMHEKALEQMPEIGRVVAL